MRFPNSLNVVPTPLAAAAAGLFRSGQYINAQHAGRTTLAMTLNRVYYVPLRVLRPRAIDRLAMEITTNVATAVIRVGVYADDDAYNFPGRLMFEAGSTIDGATATGLATVTVAQTLPVGLVWLACCAQTAAPTIRSSSSPVESVPVADPTGSSPGAGALTQASVTGALPAVAAPTSNTGNLPLVFVRAA